MGYFSQPIENAIRKKQPISQSREYNVRKKHLWNAIDGWVTLAEILFDKLFNVFLINIYTISHVSSTGGDIVKNTQYCCRT